MPIFSSRDENKLLVDFFLKKNYSLCRRNVTMPRLKKSPRYLKDYHGEVEVLEEWEFPKTNLQNDALFNEWKTQLLQVIRIRMDHRYQKNYNIQVGVTNFYFLFKLLGPHIERRKESLTNININGRVMKTRNFIWRFTSKDYLPVDCSCKLYKGENEQYYKITTNWVRFKFNQFTQTIICTGKYQTWVMVNGEWVEL